MNILLNVSLCYLIQVNSKMVDVENNNTQLDTLRTQLSGILDECEQLYNVYADKRNKVSTKCKGFGILGLILLDSYFKMIFLCFRCWI